MNQQRRISQDALYNLHEIAYDLPEFVWVIQTYPSLICVCGMQEVLDQLDRLLLVDSPSQQLLSYDTTFQLGDFYVSPLLFRHTLFTESPVLPALFLIHERKFETAHEQLFKLAGSKVTALTRKPFPVVTDEEKGIVNAIEKHLPNATRLRCWNHIFRGARHWGHSHNIKANEIQGFVADLKELFHKPSIDAYETELQQRSTSWNNPVFHYYMKNIHPEVYTSIGRWVLEAEGVYSPFSGVVTNQSESFNMVLKSLQQWKEVPVDCIVLSFYLLQSYFMNEVTRGLAGQGSYHLHPQFLPLMEEAEVSEPVFICVRPHDIVTRIREKDDITSTADSNRSQLPQEEDHTQAHKPPSALSQLERARIILESGKISFDPKLHLFNVLGSGDRPYVVRLFPRETCSCPSSGSCYHIIAVKMSIGSNTDAKQVRRLNLTMLRKKTRSRKDKTSGRKRPRKADTESNPKKRQKRESPDSDISEEEDPQWLKFQQVLGESKKILKQHQQGKTQFGRKRPRKVDTESNPKKRQKRESPASSDSDISEEEDPQWLKFQKVLGESKKILKQHQQSKKPSGQQVSPPQPERLVPYSGSDDSFDASPTCSTPTKAAAPHTMVASPVRNPSSSEAIAPPNNTDPESTLPSTSSKPSSEATAPPNTDPESTLPSTSSKPDSTLPHTHRQTNEAAGKLLFYHREKKRREKRRNQIEMPEVINVDEHCVKQYPIPKPKDWIKQLGLTQDDKSILQSTEWLNDELINASQKVLATQFKPKFGDAGFQASTIGLCGTYTIETGEFIQILHNGADHWLTITTIGTSHPEVLVYDSLCSTVPEKVKSQISSLLCTRERSVRLQFVDVVKQAGVNDCGVFAVAYATALCLGKSPGKDAKTSTELPTEEAFHDVPSHQGAKVCREQDQGRSQHTCLL